MADTEVDTRPSSTRDESSDSESSIASDDGETSTPVEWLATGRSKRSTAGNRMKSMIATEEPDDELELLFAEDGSDGGFTDVDDGGSDVQMDSSSDSEDENKAADDDLEGERELERQAREKRTVQRKRKAQEAIPAKFRKKVRINDRPSASPRPEAPKPAPRPKKKSERTSWLPTTADMPTRASARQTTVFSKEQLHQQMLEREKKRLKQVEAMEKKAKKLEAQKKPPMTQEERLAEAARVEKRNAKSLNRWEEAEKAREEERKAKLAALNNRTLKGPVVTMWSGMGIWEGDDKGGHAVSIEEKPARKKREKKDKGEKGKDKAKGKGPEEAAGGSTPGTPAAATPTSEKPGAEAQLPAPTNAPAAASGPTSAPNVKTEEANPSVAPSPAAPPAPETTPTTANADEQPKLVAPPSISPPVDSPAPGPPSTPTPPGLKAPVLAPPVLAPPMGAHLNGHSMNPKSSVLAPPNTTQRPSPLSLPPMTPNQTEGAEVTTSTNPPTSTPAPSVLQPTQPKAEPAATSPAPESLSLAIPPTAPAAQDSQDPSPATAQENTDPAAAPSTKTKTTRHAIILQNFDKELIRDKTAQTQVLFGRRQLSKIPKPAPVPICAITGHPARYRDPHTGLHYHNSYAYRELQRLVRGEYRFSALVGAWMGSCSYAARGVPDRFLNGGPRREKKDVPTEKDKLQGQADGPQAPEQLADGKKADAPASAPQQPPPAKEAMQPMPATQPPASAPAPISQGDKMDGVQMQTPTTLPTGALQPPQPAQAQTSGPLQPPASTPGSVATQGQSVPENQATPSVPPAAAAQQQTQTAAPAPAAPPTNPPTAATTT